MERNRDSEHPKKASISKFSEDQDELVAHSHQIRPYQAQPVPWRSASGSRPPRILALGLRRDSGHRSQISQGDSSRRSQVGAL